MKTQLTGLFLSRLRNRIGVESCGPRLHLINLIFKFFFLSYLDGVMMVNSLLE